MDLVKPNVPRVLINRDCVHRANYLGKVSKGTFQISTDGFWFGKKELDKHNYRDIFVQGDCDKIVQDICSSCGWLDELLQLSSKIMTEMRRTRMRRVQCMWRSWGYVYQESRGSEIPRQWSTAFWRNMLALTVISNNSRKYLQYSISIIIISTIYV